MAKLKALNQKEFEILYNSIPLTTLAKELDIDDKPLWQRAKKYNLAPKPMGRPVDKICFKGESRYSPEVTELLIKTLIIDGASDKRLIEKGYDKNYIAEMRIKYSI